MQWPEISLEKEGKLIVLLVVLLKLLSSHSREWAIRNLPLHWEYLVSISSDRIQTSWNDNGNFLALVEQTVEASTIIFFKKSNNARNNPSGTLVSYHTTHPADPENRIPMIYCLRGCHLARPALHESWKAMSQPRRGEANNHNVSTPPTKDTHAVFSIDTFPWFSPIWSRLSWHMRAVGFFA